MLRQPIAITSDWDYQVEKVPAFTPEGKATGSFMTRRVDNGRILKVGVTKDYNVVQNRELIQPVEDVLSDLGLEPTERKAYVMKNGERMRMRYIFRDEQVKIPKVGDTMGFRMDVDNSFNLSHRIRTIGGAERLVCTNGMTTLENEVSMTKKHSANVETSFLEDAIKKAVSNWDNAVAKAETLTARAIEHEQGLTILGNLVRMGALSDRMSGEIAKVWNSPEYDLDKDRNLYNLYNATTQHLTRNVENTRSELADRTSRNVFKKLHGAAHRETDMAKLLLPLKTVEVEKN